VDRTSPPATEEGADVGGVVDAVVMEALSLPRDNPRDRARVSSSHRVRVKTDLASNRDRATRDLEAKDRVARARDRVVLANRSAGKAVAR
jgi:hypothetical protein